jgi:SulP family sulfate permease
MMDFSAVGDIDYTAAYVLGKLVEALQEKKIGIVLMNVTKPVSAEMERSGLTKLIGAENIFQDAAGAIAAMKKLAS